MEGRSCNIKKTVVARLDAGDDLLVSLTKCAEEHGITSGWFCLFGGAKEISYGLYQQGEHRHHHRKTENIFELLPTFGNISIKEGKVFIHCHITAADDVDGKAFGGHLMEGTKIFPFAEVFMQECDIEIERSYDKTTNLWPMKFV